MRPDEEIEVEEREYVDLERQGLLHQQEQKESGEAAPADEKPARSRRDQ